MAPPTLPKTFVSYKPHTEPTHDWQQIRSLLKDAAQIDYEVIRPVILWGQTPKERGMETGVSPRTCAGYLGHAFRENDGFCVWMVQ